MRCLNSFFTISVLAISATALQAQSMPEGMFIDGRVSLSYSASSDSSSTAFAYTFLDIGLRPGGGSAGLGFTLGIEGFDSSKDTGSTGKIALYPALTYQIAPNTRISAGIPRFVSQRGGGYLDDPVFAYSEEGNLGLYFFQGSLAARTYLLLNDINLYGLRVDHSAGPLSIGASYHHFESNSGDYSDVFALAFAYDLQGALPDGRLFGAFERLTMGSGDRSSYQIGISAGSGKLRGIFL